MFEAVSACGTVGLSLGETGRLDWPGKLILAAAMYAGRVGPLTLLMSLTRGAAAARYRYPSENLVVG
jgi:trk system potassium uptake protein TrkH